MTRVKSGVETKKRHKKVLKEASGYFGSKHRLYKSAKEQLMHSQVYAYRDRRQKKREFRKLWITRINAACRENGISYSKFIDGLNKAGVEIDRKMLSELAINDMEAFKELVRIAKGGKVIEHSNIKKEETKVSSKEKSTNTKKEETKVSSKEKPTNTKKEETKNLSSMTVAELKVLAKEKNIEGYTTMKKAELLEALK